MHDPSSSMVIKPGLGKGAETLETSLPLSWSDSVPGLHLIKPGGKSSALGQRSCPLS